MNLLLPFGFPTLIASFGDDVAPMVLGVMLFMIPIVAILTSHQRKMAKIMRDDRALDTRSAYESEQMRRELADLKALVHQQAIMIDNLAMKANAPAEITQRLENVH